MRASAKELLHVVPFFTPLVWCGPGLDPATSVDAVPTELLRRYKLAYYFNDHGITLF